MERFAPISEQFQEPFNIFKMTGLRALLWIVIYLSEKFLFELGHFIQYVECAPVIVAGRTLRSELQVSYTVLNFLDIVIHSLEKLALLSRTSAPKCTVHRSVHRIKSGNIL